MALLDVKNVRKVYTTRFGGNQVEALKDVNFSVERICSNYGGIWFRKKYTS